MIEFLIIAGLASIVFLILVECSYDCATFGLSKKYRIKVIGGNVYAPQYRYLILWEDIFHDDKSTQEWAQRVIEQDKSGELRAKDIKYIDIK